MTTILGLEAVHAQEQRKRKVPGIDKVTSGSSYLAFEGKVESLDLKMKVLNVKTPEGDDTEIFPFKKGVRVTTADGAKFKLEELAPGTNVIVYFDQKADRRAVKQVVVLPSGGGKRKNASPPS